MSVRLAADVLAVGSGNFALAVLAIVFAGWVGGVVTFSSGAPVPWGIGTLLVVSTLVRALYRRLTRESETEAAVRWGAEHGWTAGMRSMRPRGGRRSALIQTVLGGVRVASFTSQRIDRWRKVRRHVVLSALPADFPLLTITAERRAGAGPVAHRMESDRQLESADFNDRWTVRCADARFSHDFVHPRLMERLMQPDVEGLSVIVVGPDVAVHAPGATSLDELPARAALLADIVRGMPGHLVTEYPGSVLGPIGGQRPLLRVLEGRPFIVIVRASALYVLGSAGLAVHAGAQGWAVDPLVLFGAMVALLASSVVVLLLAEAAQRLADPGPKTRPSSGADAPWWTRPSRRDPRQ